MRILMISGFYPPIGTGGYAQNCAEVSKRLRVRGHKVKILTSRLRADSIGPDGDVFRLLHLENDLNYYSPRHFFTRWVREERQNQKIVTNLLNEFQPDLVFVWAMYGLSRSVPATLERLMPDRVIYFISDHWPLEPTIHEMYWNNQAKSTVSRFAKAIMRTFASLILKLRNYPPKLQFKHTLIVSAAVRRNLVAAKLPFENGKVVHSGREPGEFLHLRNYEWLQDRNQPLRLLYAGRLGRHKGVHLAIKALAHLRQEMNNGKLRLTIYGDGHPKYKRELEQLIARNSLHEEVSLAGEVPHKRMPEILRNYDILLVPSICEDALPGIVQEAMMSGLAVIGSNRGGIPEMLLHGKTGLTYEAEKSEELANQIRILISDRQYMTLLAKQGQLKALREFTSELMVSNIERYMEKLPGMKP